MAAESVALDTLNLSMSKLLEVLAKMCNKAENELNSEISKVSKNGAESTNQGTLLVIQAKLQSWNISCSTATGILRSFGDTLKTTVHNIR
ncbi:MAG: EscF/YscF/HrpA family type III secretion system needle major subunit [Puniceicoccales bacterium]|jgi:hypothetical protein|nr:EscF/YscF/HrpA family type III secretion system needle major subunit [Puniceicoccales bacterium]